ncbi:Response regulator PleD [Paraglaciecola mesophila]|uniref:Response regulator PleD n=1 Tax=Paraglaciecola mesophila TaxID=197222 RepID=A0A857JP25_9ALTE|nr:diguanylate cyclase [Paraglaciecola mesophila]QHJ13118.1 Response regulator PleD [Paraglaciecola mesophila]
MFKNGMIWVVLSVFFSIGISASERTFFSFTPANFSKQLSQKTVRQVYQDSTGYLWFVTQEGLSRYDGYQLLKFVHDPRDPSSISSDNVRSILEDNQKRLWIVTDGGGLNRFEPLSQTFTKWRAGGEKSQSIISDHIRSMYLASDGAIWLGYNNGSFSRLNQNDMKFEHFNTRELLPELTKNAFVTSIAEDKHNIWLATDGNGLLQLNKDTYQLRRYFKGGIFPLFSDRLTKVFIDNQKRIWLTSYDAGISIFEVEKNTFSAWRHDPRKIRSIASDLVHTVYQDHHQRLWFGTEGGLSLFDENGGFTTFKKNNGMSDNKILSILQDPSGIMWLGTYSGITKGIEVPFEQIDKGLASKIVLGFAETTSSKGERTIWVAGYDGLTQLDSAGQVQNVLNAQSVPALNDTRVMTVSGDKHILWFGTRGGGLGRLNVDTMEVDYLVHDPNNSASLSFDGVTSIHLDQDKNLWVGTFGGGLNLLKHNGNGFAHFREQHGDLRSLNHDRVVAVSELLDGRIIVGTIKGINIFNPTSLDFDRIEHEPDNVDSLSAPMAWAFYQDDAEQLWVGTQGGGLNQWRKKDLKALNNHFSRYNSVNGLPSSHIYSIQADEMDNLWLSSTAGLSRFNPATGKIRHFDSSQGLNDSEFNFGAGFTDSQGVMYFGGNFGFVRFQPNEIKDSKTVPPVVLVRIKKLNEEVGVDIQYQEQHEIVLNYLDYYISFEFAALDFNAPELNEYRYKLEGLDPNWVELGHARLASFSNLPPGKYVLKVQASNHLGLWNSEGVALQIRVLPPPWRTWWAYSVYAILLIVIVLDVIRRYRLKQQRASQHLIDLEEKVEERTTDLRLVNEKLEQISFTDPLTGLKNRRYLTQHLDNDVELILAKHREYSLNQSQLASKDADLIFFLMDLDHFKQVNDKYGHSAGDAVLVAVKSILETVFRDTDYLLRWGGEEFLIVARFVDRSSAATLAERLRCAIQAHRFNIEDNTAINVTCSIGFSVFPLLSNQPTVLNWERTIDVADLCLYAAKKSNRNTWVGLLDLTCDEQDVFSAVVDKTEQLIQSGQLTLVSSISDINNIRWR